MQKKVTINIDSRIYDSFHKFCNDNDIIISKRIERLMNNEVQKNKSVKNVKNE